MADLMTGEQPAVVAERYGLLRNTVKSWRVRMDAPAHAPADASAVAPASTVVTVRRPMEEARQQTLAELVEANLRAKLIATQRIAEYASRDEWLAQQSATAVAELFGAIDRSAVGILDRLAAAHQPAALPAPDNLDERGAG